MRRSHADNAVRSLFFFFVRAVFADCVVLFQGMGKRNTETLIHGRNALRVKGDADRSVSCLIVVMHRGGGVCVSLSSPLSLSL